MREGWRSPKPGGDSTAPKIKFVGLTPPLFGDLILLTSAATFQRRHAMAQIKVYYEPEMELLTVFWQAPRKNQICTELGDGVILMKDETTGQPIGLELLS